MKQSILSLAMILAAAGGFAAAAQAADTLPTTTQNTASVIGQAAAMPSSNLATRAAIENAAEQAYQQNINPLATVTLAGPYDIEDAFTGKNGTPLPGWDLFHGNLESNQ